MDSLGNVLAQSARFPFSLRLVDIIESCQNFFIYARHRPKAHIISLFIVSLLYLVHNRYLIKID